MSHLHDITDDLRTSGEWKIHLTMKLSLMSSKDSHEKCLNDSKSNNKEIMISVDTEKITRKRFNSLLYWYQVRLDQSMKNSDFLFFLCFITLADCSISVIR